MKKYLQLVSLIAILVLVSCGGNDTRSKTPLNVRELMESDGWEYCQLVSMDYYSNGAIHEDFGTYDLFRRGNDYALTCSHSDQKRLGQFEERKSTYWIEGYAIAGDYIVTGKLLNDTDRPVVTYRYNAKCVSEEGYPQVFFIIN